jgi:hypothetical protein
MVRAVSPGPGSALDLGSHPACVCLEIADRGIRAGCWAHGGGCRHWRQATDEGVDQIQANYVSSSRGVRRRQCHNEVDVVLGVVVAVDGLASPGRSPEVPTHGAEVAASSEGSVVDVVGVAHAVLVTIDSHDRPGRRKELHGADSAVPHRVAVELAGVGVGNPLNGTAAVEHRSDDGW